MPSNNTNVLSYTLFIYLAVSSYSFLALFLLSYTSSVSRCNVSWFMAPSSSLQSPGGVASSSSLTSATVLKSSLCLIFLPLSFFFQRRTHRMACRDLHFPTRIEPVPPAVKHESQPLGPPEFALPPLLQKLFCLPLVHPDNPSCPHLRIRNFVPSAKPL